MRNAEADSRMLSRSSALLGCELLVDDLLERVVRLRTADRAAVDEEGRRSVHACLLAVAQVGVDLGLELVRVDAGVELGGVEAELRRVLLQIGAAQLRRVGKQAVMVRPELSLLVGTGRG